MKSYFLHLTSILLIFVTSVTTSLAQPPQKNGSQFKHLKPKPTPPTKERSTLPPTQTGKKQSGCKVLAFPNDPNKCTSSPKEPTVQKQPKLDPKKASQL